MSAADVQETAQALFCAIIDTNQELVLDNSILSTAESYDTFKARFDKQNIKISTIFKNKVKPKATLKQVERFLQNPNKEHAWFKSSRQIAIELFKQIKSVAGVAADIDWTQIFYYHAKSDPNGIKTIINNLFSTANGLLPVNKFPSIDRWSPADIYFSTKSGIDKLKKLEEDNLPFNLLNPILIGMIQEGILIPISLKKNPGGGVTIKSVNFDRRKEIAEIKKYGYYGIMPNVKVFAGSKEKDPAKYLPIKILEDSVDEFVNFRFSGNNFRVEIVLRGQARGGSISSTYAIQKIITRVDSIFSNELFGTNGIVTRFKRKEIDASKAREELKNNLESFSKNNKQKADKLMQRLSESAGSRTKQSAPHVIVK